MLKLKYHCDPFERTKPFGVVEKSKGRYSQ